MRWRDTVTFLVVFWVLTALQGVVAYMTEKPVDEFDALHALILACTVVITGAIREQSA